MKRIVLLAAMTALAACEGGFSIPDFRGSGGDDRGTFRPDPVASDPVELPAPLVAKERLVAAIEANGCVFSTATATAILSTAAVGTDELGGLMTELEAEGRIVSEGSDALRIVSPTCTA